jgi:hypothetical protein
VPTATPAGADDDFYGAVLGRRERLIAGVFGIGLGALAPFALSVVLLARTGDPAFVIFPLPFLGALWVIQGLAPAGYTLEDDGVRIERRWASRFVPYDRIQAVDRTPRPIGGLLALGLNALFGSHGVRWNPWTGFHYLAVTNSRDRVYLRTARGFVVISPSEPDRFVDRLSKRLARARAMVAPEATPAGSGRGAPAREEE